MVPLKKTVWPASTAHTAGASPRKTRAQKVFIARRSSRFHEAASSVQRFNANHVKRKFFSFASWNLFRMEELFSALPSRMVEQFSFAKPISIYKVDAPRRAAALKLKCRRP